MDKDDEKEEKECPVCKGKGVKSVLGLGIIPEKCMRCNGSGKVKRWI